MYPAGHDLQNDCLTDDWNLPLGHSPHEEALLPDVASNLPATHAMQPDRPFCGWCWPAPHKIQSLARPEPVLATYWPDEQLRHDVGLLAPLASLYFPAPQSAHGLCAAVENLPLEHSLHEVPPARDSVSVTDPFEHAAHATFGSLEYMPAAHGTQDTPAEAVTTPEPFFTTEPPSHTMQSAAAVEPGNTTYVP